MSESVSPTGHRPIDHTGDVAFEIWAPSEEELLREAARAATELMLGEAAGEIAEEATAERAPTEAIQERTVRLETLDREDRLVQWLNEIIFFATCEGLVFRRADLSIRPEAEGEILRAEIAFEPAPEGGLATELKSATYHDIRVGEDGPGGALRARVVIDV